MLVAFFLLASVADWVPARWSSGDPKTLDLVTETPINCLLLEQFYWSAEFAEKGASLGIATLGVIRPGADSIGAVRLALAAKLTGVVLEGDFDSEATQRVRDSLGNSRAVLVELPPRGGLRWNDDSPVLGTYQGVWPGIQVQEGGAAKAAPTGAPWIDTNSGFLRFLRAATDASVWIGYSPPPATVVPAVRYLQAISDAALVGARWIVTLDEDFNRRLLERDAGALKVWRRMMTHIQYFEQHKEWRVFRPHGQLALVQDADSGALLSGSILDMIAVKHTPVRPVPRWKLSAEALKGARIAVNADPEPLSGEETEVLRSFARTGGTLLSAPLGWKFPPIRNDQIMLSQHDLEKLDAIWKEVRSLIGRNNLGARLFNVSSMLSNLLVSPRGKPMVLQLVNYSGYPVESVTAHFLGHYKRARLISPEAPLRELEVYPIKEGSGVDIPEVSVCATIVLD